MIVSFADSSLSELSEEAGYLLAVLAGVVDHHLRSCLRGGISLRRPPVRQREHVCLAIGIPNADLSTFEVDTRDRRRDDLKSIDANHVDFAGRLLGALYRV